MSEIGGDFNVIVEVSCLHWGEQLVVRRAARDSLTVLGNIGLCLIHQSSQTKYLTASMCDLKISRAFIHLTPLVWYIPT